MEASPKRVEGREEGMGSGWRKQGENKEVAIPGSDGKAVLTAR